MVHLLLGLLVVATPHAQKMAVLDMVDLSGDQGTLALQLTQVVVSEVVSKSDLRVISSSEIGQVLSYEKQKELLGCKDDSCVTELAGALGVDFLMMAQVGKIGSRYRIDVRIVDARHASLIGSAGDFVSGNLDDVADATVKLTQSVLAQSHLTKVPVANLAAPASTSPAAAVSTSDSPRVSHLPAYVSWGIAAGLVVAAAAMTAVTISTYNNASSAKDLNYQSDANTLSWKGPLTDGLWVGAAVAGGIGTYFYFSATPAVPGSGGEVLVGGRF